MNSDQGSFGIKTSLKIMKTYKRKLHQIACLENLDRKLTPEELSMVSISQSFKFYSHCFGN